MTAVTLMKKQPEDQGRKIETASTYSWVLSQAEGGLPPSRSTQYGKAARPCPTHEPPRGGQTAPVLSWGAVWQCREGVGTGQARGAAYLSLCGMHFLRTKHI